MTSAWCKGYNRTSSPCVSRVRFMFVWVMGSDERFLGECGMPPCLSQGGKVFFICPSTLLTPLWNIEWQEGQAKEER